MIRAVDESTLGAMEIKETLFSWTKDDDGASITTLGVIKNPARFAVHNVMLELKFFDEQKKLVDVVSGTVYDLTIPANQEVAFRLQRTAAQSKTSYASVTARIIAAQTRDSPSAEKPSALLEFLVSWGPMIALIAGWIWLIRRTAGKNSPAVKTLALIEQQNALLQQQVTTLERLTGAIEKRAGT